MTVDVSAAGLKCYILASTTFPLGFSVNAFADDEDPITVAPVRLAEGRRDINGKFYSKGKQAIVEIVVSVIAGSYEDWCLSTVVRANFNSTFLRPAMDEMNMTISFPDGTTFTLTAAG